MRTLQQSLSEYGDAMLRAIAEQWQVAGDDPETLPARLAAAMLEPGHLQALLESLEPEARAVLAQLVAAGGSIRGHLLTSVHGEVRRLGPRAIEREKPWLHPASPTERLWYAGLIFRRYSRLGNYLGEVYYIPADLLAALPPQHLPAGGTLLQPVAEPERAVEERDALALDVETVLTRLRLTPVAARPGTDLAAALLSPLSPRWRGAADPERLALLQHLALRSRLIVKRGAHYQVGPQARAWLLLGPYERQKRLFEAWQSDPYWNELWRVPSLRCEETGWRNDPLAARTGLLQALRLAPDGWLRLPDLVAAIKATQPDFARPNGDYDSWYIRDVTTGQYLRGFAHWDNVEGALIAHLTGRSLYWLGAVALGRGGEGQREMLLRLTGWGRAFLRLMPPPREPRPAPAVVGEDLTIRVPRDFSAYDRARLERFARWQGRAGDDDLFRMDGESAWQAFNAGIQAPQVIAFLQRITGRRLPDQAVRTLHAWATRYGQVTLRRAILLQTRDTETLHLLRNDPELGQRLGVAISERAVLIPEDQLPQVLKRLRAMGLWPRLEGLASTGSGPTEA